MRRNQWGRETTPPIHRQPPPSELRWLADWMVQQVMDHPGTPPKKVQWIPDPSYPPEAMVWLQTEVEAECLRRGLTVILQMQDQPERPMPPTPGELLAASMTKLPALPPTAGGYLPEKV